MTDKTTPWQSLETLESRLLLSTTLVNHAPVLDTSGTMTMAKVYSNVTTNPGTLVRDIIASAGGNRITDVDAGAVEGIAVVATNNSNGTWQYTINGGSTWTNFKGYYTSARLLAADASTAIRFVPNSGYTGTMTSALSFRAWDQTAGANGSTINATKTGGSTSISTATENVGETVATDHAPVMAAISHQTATAGKPITFTVAATDQDGDALTYSVVGLPKGATFNSKTGVFNWTPSSTQVDTYGMKFTVSDGYMTASQTMSVTVNAPAADQAPTLNPIGSKTATVGKPITFTVVGNDPDGDPLTYSVVGLPTGATFNSQTGVFNWTASSTQVDTYGMNFTASDGTLTASQTMAITVNAAAAADQAPTLNPIGSKTATAGTPITFTVVGNDPDGDPLTYSVVGLPTGATFNSQTGVFNWTPSSTQVDTWGMNFTASDGTLTASQTMAITVNAAGGTGGTGGTGTGGGTVTGVGATSDILNRSVTMVDVDGDGYGPNSSKGVDADPNDPTVQTYAQGIAKYGSQTAFLAHLLGYTPTHIYTSMPSTKLQAGDVVMLSAGTYYNYFNLQSLNGTASAPITIMAKPGDNVVLGGGSNAILIEHCNYVNVDGFNVDGTLESDSYNGIQGDYSSNLTFENIDAHGWVVGLEIAQDLHNITIKDSVFHDQKESHGVYIGARDYPNSNILVQGNLFFNNKNGFQHNGRVTGLTMQNNIFHNNWLAGISWLEGVHDSTIKNNLIFNNGTQGIVVNDYNDDPVSEPDILPYDQNNNTITNNTIWVGQNSVGGPYTPADQQAMVFTDASSQQGHDLSANITKNILVTYNGATVRFGNASYANSSSFSGNQIYRVNGSSSIVDNGGTMLNWSAFNSKYSGNTYGDPGFANVSLSYANSPQSFNFNTSSTGTGGTGTGTGGTGTGGTGTGGTGTSTNNAPVLDNTSTMTMGTITNGATNNGTLVSDIIASAGGNRITDVDAGALEGIAVVATDNTNGSWQYSIDGGSSWTTFTGYYTGATTLASNASTRVRFVPNAGFSGTVNPGISFRAWDQTAGVNGGTIDAMTTGGSSSISTATETVSITVNPAVATNQAPVMAAISSMNDTVGQPVSFTVNATDPDGDPLTYSVLGLPAGATFDTKTGKFNWTPTSSQVDIWGMKFTASDGSLTASQTACITVAAASGTGGTGTGGTGTGGTGTGGTGTGGTGTGGSTTGMGASADVLNRNRVMIDKDGDGYGVNSPLGPDANDNDSSVNTYNSVIAKYGTVQNFVTAGLGYHPKHIYMGDPGSVQLQPGDMVIVTGNMSGNYTYGSSNTNGTTTDPIVFLAMPGKDIKITAQNDAIDISHCTNEIWDGFDLDGSSAAYGLGINMSYSQNITFKNLNVYGWSVGMQAAQNLVNIDINNCVFHDSDGSHGLYLESREQPDTNLYVHDNLFFNNKNGMQMNGRVTNLDIENNVFYNNWLAGISWLEGVHDSTIKNNLIFNNGTQGIVINDYDDTPSFGIVPYDQTNNLIVNNTIWVGQHNGNLTGAGAGYDPVDQQAIAFTDATAAQSIMMSAIIKNNVIVTDNGSTFRMEPSKFSSASTISNNLIYRYSGSGNIMLTGNTTYGISSLPSFNSANTGNIFDSVSPFVDVALSYYTNPTKFNFNLA